METYSPYAPRRMVAYLLGDRETRARMRRLLRWGAFESWKDAIDVAFKILAGVAAFGALNLLTVRADVDTLASCDEEIDEGRVAQAYEESGLDVPDVVIQFIRDYNSNSFFYATFAASAFAASVPPSQCAQPFGSPLVATLPGSFETSPVAHDMTEDEVRRAVEAITVARMVQVRVRVTNVGRSDAIDVTFMAPDGYARTAGPGSAFDLPPGEARNATFEATPSAPAFAPADFEPLWSATQVVDVWGLLLLAGGLLLVFWLPFLIAGLTVQAPGVDAHGHRTGAGRPLTGS